MYVILGQNAVFLPYGAGSGKTVVNVTKDS